MNSNSNYFAQVEVKYFYNTLSIAKARMKKQKAGGGKIIKTEYCHNCIKPENLLTLKLVKIN